MDGLQIKKRARALAGRDVVVDENGKQRVPLRVLAPPSCPHLHRYGRTNRKMMCKKASELAGYEIPTTSSRCKYECRALGGPYMGREMSEEERGRFTYWMVLAQYKQWSPTQGISKYIRKLATVPRFFVPPEAQGIRDLCADLLEHPNVEAVCMVGSLIFEKVERPLVDHDLMVVVKDFDEYCRDIDGFRSLLPQTHPGNTDWFVGCSPAGTLAAVDVSTGTLHLAFDFEYEAGDGIEGVEKHELLGPWPEDFQKRIEDERSKRQPGVSSSEAKKEWNKNENIWRRAAKFTRSMMSGRGVDEETYAQRHASCHGTLPDGTVVGKPCSYRKKSRGHGYFCGVCGCGDTGLANLSPDPKSGKSKLQFVELTCPIGAKGFSNAGE